MKYIIRFLTTDGDIASEWVEASSDEEAADVLLKETTNIKQIISIIEV